MIQLQLAGLQCTTEGFAITRCDRLQEEGISVDCDALGVPAPKVCDVSSCWCVSSAGQEIPGTRGDLNITCPERSIVCVLERDSRAAAPEIWGLPLLGSVYPQCNVWGSYKSKQCLNGDCWCVDPDSGVEVNDTSCLSDPKTTLYSSYFGEDIQVDPPVQQHPSSCSSEQEQVTLSLADREVQISLPLCSSAGEYFPQQFRSDVGEWWCVDPLSGDEVSGQRGPRHTLPCSGAGLGQVLFDSVKIPGCVMDEIDQVIDEDNVSKLKCENYSYSAVQCLLDDGYDCYCVTSDTGIPLSSSYSYHTRLSCPDMVETPCLRAQFETCLNDTTSLLLPSCPDETPWCNQETGNFLPQQCDNGTCYCVNIVSGQVLNVLSSLTPLN